MKSASRHLPDNIRSGGMRRLELLAPARNADIGIEAIRHGADAVYIGAGRFGARAAAGNSIEEIARLVRFAHFFNAKVYVAVNTIMDDVELHESVEMINMLYEAGVDAVILQDMGLLKMNLPPIGLHASTQMDNRSADKVRFLRELGFEQVVLARELSLDEIREIHTTCPDVALEVFVHGALCVSYSGQCYLSESCFGRSANRGECAQVCRMEFDLEDADGNKLVKGKHLLSLKDMCRIDDLERLLEAGVSSFKIEGRLKDMDYVKNVTAAYSKALDKIVSKHPERYYRASSGVVRHTFVPDVNKSFNRGFTKYFLDGRRSDIFSFDTPKAKGEYVGRVKEVGTNYFTVSGKTRFVNGDGLCFTDDNGKLCGFRVNRVDENRLYPLEKPASLRSGIELFRNQNHQFSQLMSRESAVRVIPVDVSIDETEKGFRLTMTDDDGCSSSIDVDLNKELARSHQKENIELQLSKLGGTNLELRNLFFNYTSNWFIPSSCLSAWRRELAGKLIEQRSKTYRSYRKRADNDNAVLGGSPKVASYLYNVMNSKAEEFYLAYGFEAVEPAFEKQHQENVPLMFCKHCLKYSLGLCLKNNAGRSDSPNLYKIRGIKEPMYLALANGMRFRLDFDCSRCMMTLTRE